MVNGAGPPVVTRDVAEELDLQGDTELVSEFEAERQRIRDAEFPEPTIPDIAMLRDSLRVRFAGLHDGMQATSEQKQDGINGIRDMRYGRDQTPDKLKARLNNDGRVRTMLTHKEIERTRALLSRNPMKIRIPAASNRQAARDASAKETRWANELAPALERQAIYPPIQESDDAMCEAFGGWEIYLTNAYDAIDFDRREGEDAASFNDRIEEALKTVKLPFGIRALDPLSTMFDVLDDQMGHVLIIEKKPLRVVYNAMRKKFAGRPGEFEKLNLPKPEDAGSSGLGVNTATADLASEVETIRYYDPVWYVYTVADEIVVRERHGMPGTPIVLAFGYVTSAGAPGDKLQGITYGLAQIEKIINDAMTQDIDSFLTYNRPRPMAEADADVATPENTENIDLSGPELKMLPPGYRIVDAFKEFNQLQTSPAVGTLLSFWARGTPDPVVGGTSPGADTSGFALNQLMQSALAPFSPLFANKERAWGQVVDFIRRMIRDTIGEKVYLQVRGTSDNRDDVEWLELGPDDISDVSASVSLDPLSDFERVAIAKWLEGGVATGVVPERILQTKGYGADDPGEWNDEIDMDRARRALADLRTEQAMQELIEESEAENAAPPTIFGPNGEPIQSAAGGAGGAQPRAPQPSTVGTSNSRAQRQNFAEATAGQKPIQQGVSAAGAAGGGV